MLEVIPDVVEQGQRTVGEQELVETNNQTTIVNLKASVAPSPPGQKLSGNAFWRNCRKKSIVFDDKLIKELTQKRPGPREWSEAASQVQRVAVQD